MQLDNEREILEATSFSILRLCQKTLTFCFRSWSLIRPWMFQQWIGRFHMLSSEVLCKWVARKRTFGSFTMRTPAFEIISKLHIQYLTWTICLPDIYKKKSFYSTEKVKHTWYTPKMLKGVHWLGSTCGCNHQPTSGYISRQWHLYAMEMVLRVPTSPHPHQKTFVTWVQAGARQHKHHRFPTLECLEPTMTWAEVSIFLL